MKQLQKQKKKHGTEASTSKYSHRLAEIRSQVPYWVMLVVPLVLFALFCYWPMFGLSMAFQNYRPGAPFFGGDTNWVGFEWFKRLFSNPFIGRWIRNTVLLSVYTLLFSFPLSVALALLLNEIRNRSLRKFTANVTLLPYFVSSVVIVGMLFNLFSVDDGVFNVLLARLGMEKINFMGSKQWFRTMYVGSAIWQGTGFNAVVFTAAISGIDPTLYDAAAINGSTRFKNIFHITIPCIKPTIITMLILKIGNIMTVGYEKIILMYSPSIYEVADTLTTYAYRAGIQDGKVSLSTAIGLLNSVVNLILLLSANKLSRKVSETSLW